jgi:hypothetical protein
MTPPKATPMVAPETTNGDGTWKREILLEEVANSVMQQMGLARLCASEFSKVDPI